MWLVLGNTTRHGHVSKLRLLTVFPPKLLFLHLRLPRHHLAAREQQRARVISRTTRSSIERSTAPFPRREYCFPSNNNRDVETMFALTLAGHEYNAQPYQTRSHETNPFSQGHCCVKPSPFHPNAVAVTVLAHIFAEIEGLTNTRQRTHRKRPLSSSTPSQDPATCSTSLRSPSRLRSGALHLHTTMVRTLATPHLHCDFTPWEMPRVSTRRHHTLHACGYLNGAAAYARSTNPAAKGCGAARRHLREKQIIFGPACLTIAPSYVRQLRKSLNLVAPSRVSTWLPLHIGIPQSRRTRAWC